MIRIKEAGSSIVPGLYVPTGEKNGAPVYQNDNGVCITRESIGGKLGWIIGLTPKAFYGIASMEAIPPNNVPWKAYAQGILPVPNILHERYSIVEAEKLKQQHNAAIINLVKTAAQTTITSASGPIAPAVAAASTAASSSPTKKSSITSLPLAQRIATEQGERRNYWMKV